MESKQSLLTKNHITRNNYENKEWGWSSGEELVIDSNSWQTMNGECKDHNELIISKDAKKLRVFGADLRILVWTTELVESSSHPLCMVLDNIMWSFCDSSGSEAMDSKKDGSRLV